MNINVGTGPFWFAIFGMVRTNQTDNCAEQIIKTGYMDMAQCRKAAKDTVYAAATDGRIVGMVNVNYYDSPEGSAIISD